MPSIGQFIVIEVHLSVFTFFTNSEFLLQRSLFMYMDEWVSECERVWVSESKRVSECVSECRPMKLCVRVSRRNRISHNLLREAMQAASYWVVGAPISVNYYQEIHSFISVLRNIPTSNRCYPYVRLFISSQTSYKLTAHWKCQTHSNILKMLDHP
jgi:hypothetical protein